MTKKQQSKQSQPLAVIKQKQKKKFVLKKASKPVKLKPNRPASQTSPFHITPCGQDYFVAINAPFTNGLMPCIPTSMPLPSQKYAVTTRGSFATNASGAGCIGMWPMRGFCRDTLSNAAASRLAPFVAYTDGLWTGTEADYNILNNSYVTVPAPAGVNIVTGTTSIYSKNDFLSLSQRGLKLVAAGMRIRFMGPVVSMGGRIISWRNPVGTNAVDATRDSITSFLANNQAATSRTTDGWLELTYRPLLETDLAAELGMGEDNYGGGGANSTAIRDRLAAAFMIQGLPSQPFEFEAIVHLEATGYSLPVTQNHADPIMLAYTLAATPTRVDPTPASSLPNAVSSLMGAIRQAGHYAVTGSTGIIGQMANEMGGGLLRFGARSVLNAAFNPRPSQLMLGYDG